MMEQCLKKAAPGPQLRQAFTDVFVMKYKGFLAVDTPNSWRNMLQNRRVACLRRTCDFMTRYDDFGSLKDQYEKFVAEEWREFMKAVIADAAILPAISNL